ncbi:MAG TPA: GIY-YIG nuclease family protein [Nitrolancea sp.]|nr:GIY-YIG nuclease family protein [Nitrolancea sp.]
MASMGGRTAMLCTGVSNNLERRVYEHKKPDRAQPAANFAAQHRTNRLVYIEEFQLVRDAIARERQIKGWRRERILDLSESVNPER